MKTAGRRLAPGVASLAFVLVVACGPAAPAPRSPAAAGKKTAPLAVVDVNEVASKPESFLGGPIAASGRVVEVGRGGQRFTLGCGDACVRVPVRFRGRAPEVQTDVVVRGRVVKQPDGRYVLEAESVGPP